MLLVRPKQRLQASRPFRYVLALAVILFAATAYSHDPGLSSAIVHVERGHLSVQLGFHGKDLEALQTINVDADGKIGRDEFAVARTQLEKTALDWSDTSVDGQPLRATRAEATFTENGDIYFQIAHPKITGQKLRVRSVWLSRLPRGHRQFLELKDEAGKTCASKMLSAGDDVLEADLPAVLARPGRVKLFWQFVVLGVEHIWMGYDHVCFLLALMIVGGSFRSVVAIITSFTVAHSITLALATFNLVQLPSSIVEPLIAVTIIYVGLENIFHHNLKWRWMLTFFFGLIHGLGFASVLRELGIGTGSGGVAIPLVAFNVGVEFGQVAIAAVVLPIVWRLRKRPGFLPRFVPAASLIIALVGGYWLIERTLLK